MKDLNDYSGGFDPDLRFEDFSKETLVKLLSVYAKLYQATDGMWYLSVKERVSNREAVACDLWVWDKMHRFEMARLCKALKIRRDGVAGLVKALQFGPWQFTHEIDLELRGKHSAIMTISYCPTLEALEREGEGREQSICREVEPAIKQKVAKFFHPSMEVSALRLPPRQTREICCQWEFNLPHVDS